jgi:hypothetical protein
MSPQPQLNNPRADLAWLFGEAESLMGYRSSFSSMIEALKGCGGEVTAGDDGTLVNSSQVAIGGEDQMIDQLDARRSMSRLGATTKERRIMRAFRKLAPHHQGVLAAFYEPRQLPPDVERVVGPVARLAPFTATARAINGYSGDWLARACARKTADARAVRIKAEATALLEQAVRAYEDAARGGTVAALRAALDLAVST